MLVCFHSRGCAYNALHYFNIYIVELMSLSNLTPARTINYIVCAGMPLISDPGSVLVRKAAESGIKIVPIPGPSAILSALVASGLPTNQFHFCGFLPPKQVARQKALQAVKGKQLGRVWLEIAQTSIYNYLEPIAERI